MYRRGYRLSKRRSLDVLSIWSDVVASDMTAWRLIVHAYTPLVLTVARRAGLSFDDVEDCAQQTWIALYRHRGAVDSPRAVPAWLIRTAHRKALTMHRNRARRADLEHLIDTPPPVSMPDLEVIALEEAAHVRLAFDQLDPRCRRLLGKLFLEDAGESYDSIARNLRIKLNSVGPLRSRCLDKLRKNLFKLGVKVD